MLTGPKSISGVAHATLASVNVGRPRTAPWGTSTVTTSIWKHPVAGRVPVRGVNLEGDDQADRTVHGGPDKAIYAYAVDDYRFWRAELGRDLAPGSFGENFTIDGLDVSGAQIGERWHIGTDTLLLTVPNTLGADYNAHVMESILKYLAPELGWR